MRKTYIVHANYDSIVWDRLINFYTLKNENCISIYDKDRLRSIQVEFTEVFHISSNGVKCL